MWVYFYRETQTWFIFTAQHRCEFIFNRATQTCFFFFFTVTVHAKKDISKTAMNLRDSTASDSLFAYGSILAYIC